MTTLPTSLVAFRAELEAAVGRERQARRRKRLALRVALVAGVAAAVAIGALTALPGDPGGRVVEAASAAQRAAAALTVAPGSVVHVDMLVTQRNPDGSQVSWREQSWQQTEPPYEQRQIVTGEDGTPVETATVDGQQQLYDPGSNTVSIGTPGSSPGTPQRATPEPVTAQPLREQVLDLLRSGKLTPSGSSSANGHETRSFTWNDGQTRYEYTVEAGTYDPVQWRFSPNDARSETTVTFDAYEVLPAGEVPLDLTRQHPGATVRRGR